MQRKIASGPREEPKKRYRRPFAGCEEFPGGPILHPDSFMVWDVFINMYQRRLRFQIMKRNRLGDLDMKKFMLPQYNPVRWCYVPLLDPAHQPHLDYFALASGVVARRNQVLGCQVPMLLFLPMWTAMSTKVGLEEVRHYMSRHIEPYSELMEQQWERAIRWPEVSAYAPVEGANMPYGLDKWTHKQLMKIPENHHATKSNYVLQGV